MAFKSQSAEKAPEKLSQAEANALFARFDRHVNGRVSAAMRALPAKRRGDEDIKSSLRKLIITAARNRVEVSALELKAMATRGAWRANLQAYEIDKTRPNTATRRVIRRHKGAKRFVFFDNPNHYKKNLRDELFGDADQVFIRVPGASPNGKNLLARISRTPEDVQAKAPGLSPLLIGAIDMVSRKALAVDLVEETDPHAYRPLKSFLMRPLVNKAGEVYYGPSRRQREGELGQTVAAYLDATLNAETYGAFRLNNPSMEDYDSSAILHRRLPIDSRGMPAGDLLDLLEVPYNARDGRIIVRGDLDLSGLGLTHLPDLSMVEVVGSFSVNDNDLIDLTGAPAIVQGEYWADNSGIRSLKGAPEHAARGFYASGNNLTDLIGAPKTVGGSFSVHENKLTSLTGSPQKVRLNFGISRNQLTSLEGGPTDVGYDYICRENRLTSLDGIAASIGKNINCDSNQLQSLHGLPEGFSGDITCGDNPLGALTGVPATIGTLKGVTGQPATASKRPPPRKGIDPGTTPTL